MIKKIIAKPHLFFIGLIPISILFVFLFSEQSLGFYYLGAYVSLKYSSLFTISSVLFGLIGLNYFSLILLKKKPQKWLTLFHIIFQVLALFFLIYSIPQENKEPFQQESILDFTFFLGFTIFLLSILLHLINFFYTFFIKSE